MGKKRVVVALGHTALGTTLPEQKEAVSRAVKSIADIVEMDYEVVITHSNGAQVSMIHTAMTEFGKQHPEYTVSPMSVCSAMSQGYIGYDLQNSLREELLNRGIYKPVCTIITQACVDPYDEAFDTPSKQIGRYMNEEEAKEEEAKDNYVVKVEGKGYRRVVASPKASDIVETDAIAALLEAGQVVIACGGGGIPVIAQGSRLKGASAVIEKDLAGAKLAEKIHADSFVILTGEEKVALHYGKENQEWIDTLSCEQAEQYCRDGMFEEGTMLPKMEAAVQFSSTEEGRQTLITSLEHAKDALEGRTGTVIKK